ncbi:hypothetical protein EVAR_11307_1 [Eumeta japonica]|uniref:Uncharacterized protein n=1 Tax=Eumeta variegata TaxID=151549 RepID=A0A4C1U144_EUMVA|nr:hypothetical protein EVAR_11307_1 [Eumeta japonica]
MLARPVKYYYILLEYRCQVTATAVFFSANHFPLHQSTPSIRFPMPSPDTGNALAISLGLQVYMGDGDHLLFARPFKNFLFKIEAVKLFALGPVRVEGLLTNVVTDNMQTLRRSSVARSKRFFKIENLIHDSQGQWFNLLPETPTVPTNFKYRRYISIRTVIELGHGDLVQRIT